MRCIVLVGLMAVSTVAMAGELETYRVERGVQIPLSLMNDVSTKNAVAGDAIYLRTTFPVVAEGRVVIPPGSWVTGTITEVRRARHGQRRGELHIRFDSLLLTNGVSRALHGDLGAHPAVGPESDKTAAANTITRSGLAGATIGPIAQIASGSLGYAGVIGGAAAGAGAAAIFVLASRGREASILRDSVVVMVLNEPLRFSASDLHFSNSDRRDPDRENWNRAKMECDGQALAFP
jgi:type IV secretion system protein VirB10